MRKIAMGIILVVMVQNPFLIVQNLMMIASQALKSMKKDYVDQIVKEEEVVV